jgi:acetyltransferase-like isoleucine patch superfamily enzyme
MMLNAWLSWQERAPRLWGEAARRLLQGEQLVIGAGVRLHGLPRVQITDGARIIIGAGVELRSDVELRAHQGAQLILEDGVRIDRGVRLLATNRATLRIGKGARVGIGSVFNGGDDIDVGAGALISGYCYLQTSMHRHERGAAIQSQGYTHAPVVLGADAWLGTHAVILPGVTVGAGAIVGSNAVVTKNVDAGAVVAGVPARPLRERE